jgi:hypothetical protein
MTARHTTRLALAAAAAVLFASTTVNAGEAVEGKVKCEGVNACKGQNSCKGLGFLELAKAECDAAKAKSPQKGT